jgi:hypothetical protein
LEFEVAASEPITKTLSETENYIIFTAREPDGEDTYNIQLNSVTLHFFAEEWLEFLDLMKKLEESGQRF